MGPPTARGVTGPPTAWVVRAPPTAKATIGPLARSIVPGGREGEGVLERLDLGVPDFFAIAYLRWCQQVVHGVDHGLATALFSGSLATSRKSPGRSGMVTKAVASSFCSAAICLPSSGLNVGRFRTRSDRMGRIAAFLATAFLRSVLLSGRVVSGSICDD